MRIGIVGAGFIGRALARLAVSNGHTVAIANSRGPHTLMSAAIALHCEAGTVAEVARAAEMVVLAIPMSAVFDLDPAPFAGRIVIDANNYYPQRDGAIPALDTREATTSGLVARHLAGAKVVKAFNAILQDDIERDARPAGAADRRALPIAGDDVAAKRIVAGLVDQFGFDPLDAGMLDDSWRFERGMPGYCVPLRTAELMQALAAAERGREAPLGAWRARREAEHAARVAAKASPAAIGDSPTNAASKRQPLGFEGRGDFDIVETQFHIGPEHDVERSLAAMDALGIRSALVDEMWGFDAKGLPQPCVALAGGGYRSFSPLGLLASFSHPARFGFIQRLDLRDPLLASSIPLLAETPGCRSVRINLLDVEAQRRFEQGEWDPALALSERHGLPVSILAGDAGRVLASAAGRFQGLTLIVDHCGWPRAPDQWAQVLELARLPNVVLKWGHAHRAFRRATDPAQARAQALVDAVRAFGADRVMWAGDVSFEESDATWSELLGFVRDHPGLSVEERAGVLGRTARRVYRWESGASGR